MIIQSAASKAEFSPDKMGKVTLCAGEYLYAGLNCFEPGQHHKAHTHADQDKLYVVLEGTALATVGDSTATVEAGSVIFAAAGVMHSMANGGPGRLVVMIVFGPPPR